MLALVLVSYWPTEVSAGARAGSGRVHHRHRAGLICAACGGRQRLKITRTYSRHCALLSPPSTTGKYEYLAMRIGCQHHVGVNDLVKGEASGDFAYDCGSLRGQAEAPRNQHRKLGDTLDPTHPVVLRDKKRPRPGNPALIRFIHQGSPYH